MKTFPYLLRAFFLFPVFSISVSGLFSFRVHASEGGSVKVETLGLWHLDGSLSDSSAFHNSDGSFAGEGFTEARYSEGIRFSSDNGDYLEFPLDSVELPDSYTLEWTEYVPSMDFSSVLVSDSVPYDDGFTSLSPNKSGLYYDSEEYDIIYNVQSSGFLGIDGGSVYAPVSGEFASYALVCDNGSFTFYRNGSAMPAYDNSLFNFRGLTPGGSSYNIFTPYSSFSYTGLSVTPSSIRFYVSDSVYAGTYRNTDRQYRLNGGLYRYNGSNKYCYSFYRCILGLSSHNNAVIDEVRLSSGVVYDGKEYTLPSGPFDCVWGTPDSSGSGMEGLEKAVVFSVKCMDTVAGNPVLLFSFAGTPVGICIGVFRKFRNGSVC